MRKFEMNLFRSVVCFVILLLLISPFGCGNNNDAEKDSGRNDTAGRAVNDGVANIGSRNVNNRTEDGRTILRLPIAAAGPGSLDPAEGKTQYDNRCVSQIYETLLQHKYLKRPLELEPLLLEELPQVSGDGKSYRFKLKQGVMFQDDPCFPQGSGRELITDDVFYSWKRLADPKLSSKNWWLLSDTIVGLDEYRDQLGDQPFDYDADIEGMQKINDYEFNIILKEASPKFRWTLAMFQLSIIPREAVEEYGSRFSVHPVGTGPYMLNETDWIRNKNMIMNRNPNYREELYPSQHMPSDETAGRTASAGQRLPLVDRIETIFYSESLPMWLAFRSRRLGFTTVPAAYYDEAFNRRKKTLSPAFAKEGITYQQVPLLDFIYYGFNMEDPVVGGYTEEKRYLRQALSLAIDWDERNHKFENDSCTIYDGMIPPGLEGYPPNGKVEGAYRGVDLERARELLAKAGFPNGNGLPPIDFYMSQEKPGPELAELTADQLGKLGVRINPRLAEFPKLIDEVNKKNAPMFMIAWLSDYPDAENNLALFYGPNESPGSNHFNYKNPEYDQLYEKIRTMPAGPERTEIYERMRDMVIRDTPFIGSMARVRQYLVNPELKNFKATEDFQNWYKYLAVE